jgi:hypothetical protein
MRAAALAFAVLVGILVSSASAAAEDFAAVGKVNKLIQVFETPQLAPGESGVFRFELNSTYTEPMLNTTLDVGIYRYATIEESVPVDGSWPYAYPQIAEAAATTRRNRTWDLGTVPAATALNLSFTVLTAADSRDMPHGSVFSQATYFLRFWLEFDGNVSGNLTHFRMASIGYFTRAQWENATNETHTDPCNPPTCRGNVNLTYLEADGSPVDGLIAESTFGVKEPIPQWPFYLLVAGAVGFLGLAFLFWVEENPGTYPRIETWWARTRGRLVRMSRAVRRPRRPSA